MPAVGEPRIAKHLRPLATALGEKVGLAMRGMTGFGEGSAENDRFRVAVTIRTVNHRFLDLQIRMPDELRAHEEAIRQRLRARLRRGRAEVRIAVQPLGSREFEVELRQQVVRRIKEEVEAAADAGLGSTELRLSDLLRVPEVLGVSEIGGRWTADDLGLLDGAVERALEATMAARDAEGAMLERSLRDSADRLDELLAGIEARRDLVRDELHRRLGERLTELLGDAGISEARLAEEAAILVERSDVREEIERARAHVAHLRELAAAEGPVGRRFEFLLQELHRELNTLGVKCRDLEMTRDVLDAKHLCEQLREQALNVE